MYKLEINLVERKKQIEALFDAWLISPETYYDMLKELESEYQAGVIQYKVKDYAVTDDEMNYYWS